MGPSKDDVISRVVSLLMEMSRAERANHLTITFSRWNPTSPRNGYWQEMPGPTATIFKRKMAAAISHSRRWETYPVSR
jgi:hypothetical protein